MLTFVRDTTWFRPGVSVGELATRREPIPEETPCAVLDAQFRADPGMSSAIIGTPADVRLLNRTAFYQSLAGPRGFGWSLHHRRAIKSLPDAGRHSLVFDAATRAEDAGLALLTAQISPTDDVLVRWDDADVGTLAASTLLAVLAEYHRVQAEVISRSERRFRTLIEHLSDAVVLLDPAGAVTYSGPTALAAAGRDPVAGRGATLLEVVHRDDVDRARAMLARTVAAPGTPHSSELRMVLPDGEVRTFEVVARSLISDPAVEGIVLNYRDVTHQRVLEDQLRHQALHDPLTGLPNRTLLLDRVAQALERIRRTARSTCLIYVDLDGFKAINDTFGHSTGDRLLEAVANAFRMSIRPNDTLARLGGDEFAVLIDDVDGVSGAAGAAARLHGSLGRAVLAGDHRVQVQVSVGIAVVDDPDVGADELLRRADMAMYAAKAQGKNRTVIWSMALQANLFEEGELCADLPGALDRGEMGVVYQPIVDMAAGRVAGVEALVRWHHPELGAIGPSRFIPLAERTGQIGRIGRWVLKTACAQVAAWRAGGHDLRLSVNLSGAQVSSADLASEVSHLLAVTGLPAAALELEVTETALIASLDSARRTLDGLKRLGVRVAIDDFGTGYSSLSYLRELPVDTLKIDKSFTDKLGRSDEDTELIGGVIRLAHSIGLTVTAEGIEDLEQEEALRRMGCDAAQGYLYSHPVDARQAGALFALRSDRFSRREPRLAPSGSSPIAG